MLPSRTRSMKWARLAYPGLDCERQKAGSLWSLETVSESGLDIATKP
jgi:hypothetical protein